MKNQNKSPKTIQSIKSQLYEIIFEADTPAGKWFDIVLLWAIIISVLVVFLESISELRN
jgi:voltage-gated potassium channel